MELKIGTFLKDSRYRIESRLKQSEFCITYLATDCNGGRCVCVKEFFLKDYCKREGDGKTVTIKDDYSKYWASYRNEFREKAQELRNKPHKNLAAISDVFEENNTAYYVMEYIQGCSLQDYVKKNRKLTEERARKYVNEVAPALKHLHSENFTHLDVTPETIMLRNADNQAILVYSDWMKKYDASGRQTGPTPVGTSEGYSPMEQYSLDEMQTFKRQSDIYSLGATLYFLVEGKMPQTASEVSGNGGVKDLSPSLSYSMRQTIEKSMKPKSEDRPKDIDEFLELLNPVSPQETEQEPEDTKQDNNVESTRDKDGYSARFIAFLVGVVGLGPLYPFAVWWIKPASALFATFFGATILTLVVSSILSVVSLVGFAKKKAFSVRPAIASVALSWSLMLASVVEIDKLSYINATIAVILVLFEFFSIFYLMLADDVQRLLPEEYDAFKAKHIILYSLILIVLILGFIFL